MKYFSLRMTAYAWAGIILAAPAQAGGLFDSDDNGYSGSYNRQNLNVYCDRYPDDDACDDEPQYKRKTYRKSYHGVRCAALIRAAGKRNLVTAFARNSARFAWRRETRRSRQPICELAQCPQSADHLHPYRRGEELHRKGDALPVLTLSVALRMLRACVA